MYSLKKLCTESWVSDTILTTWTEHLTICFIYIISFNSSHRPYKEGSNIVFIFRWQNKDSESQVIYSRSTWWWSQHSKSV